MKIKTNNLTHHAKEDRRDRREIARKMGIGKPVVEVKGISACGKPKTEILTDTGLVVVMGDNNKIVTLFLASINKACAMYKTVYGGKARLPEQLYNQIKTNNIFFADVD